MLKVIFHMSSQQIIVEFWRLHKKPLTCCFLTYGTSGAWYLSLEVHDCGSNHQGPSPRLAPAVHFLFFFLVLLNWRVYYLKPSHCTLIWLWNMSLEIFANELQRLQYYGSVNWIGVTPEISKQPEHLPELVKCSKSWDFGRPVTTI